MDQCMPGCMDKMAKEMVMKEMTAKCKMGCEAEMKKVKGDQYDNGFLNQCMEGCMPKKDDGKKGGDKKGGDKKGGDKKGGDKKS